MLTRCKNYFRTHIYGFQDIIFAKFELTAAKFVHLTYIVSQKYHLIVDTDQKVIVFGTLRYVEKWTGKGSMKASRKIFVFFPKICDDNRTIIPLYLIV